MRTVYLGTSRFAVGVLERLARSPHRPELVITRPDRPRGRGRRTEPPPVATAAADLGLEVEQPERVNSEEVLERLAGTRPEMLCLCAYGALIKEPLLSWRPILNVHPSLLPRWRGAAPVERAIEAGDRETGISIMRLVAELDAGPVCLQAAERIRPDDDFGSLSARLEPLAGDLLVEALDRQPECDPQDEEGVTYAEKIEAADRRLDPARPAVELERRVRALNPHIGTFLELPSGERLGVRGAAAREAAGVGAPGLRVDGERLLLHCSDGVLELLEVQPAGGKPMPAAAYLRGHRVS